jgi:hypothetical protein
MKRFLRAEDGEPMTKPLDGCAHPTHGESLNVPVNQWMGDIPPESVENKVYCIPLGRCKRKTRKSQLSWIAQSE